MAPGQQDRGEHLRRAVIAVPGERGACDARLQSPDSCWPVAELDAGRDDGGSGHPVRLAAAGKEMLACQDPGRLIVIPIAAAVAFATWLIMLYYAGSHHLWRGQLFLLAIEAQRVAGYCPL